MTRPTARVLQLLDLLQSAGVRSLGDLSALLDVDERTVRRYIDHLRDLGVPVETIRGRHGGYRVAPGYRMPPLMLDDDEALAVLLALTSLRADSRSPVPAMAAETAMAKLRRALPESLAERSAALLDAAAGASDGRSDAASADTSTAADPEVLLTIAEAVRRRHPLALRYRSQAGTDSEPELQPSDLLALDGRWYVAGWVPARHEVRTYRLDRIRAVRVLPGSFPEPTERITPEQLAERFARSSRRWEVVFRTTTTRVAIERELPRTVGVIEDAGDGWLRVRISAERLDWVPKILAGLPGEVVIEGPEELREVVADAGRRLVEIGTRSAG